MAKRKSITARWLITSFGIIAIVMLAVIIGVYTTAKTYYYSAVSQYLRSEVGVVAGVLNRYGEGNALSASAGSDQMRNAIEMFDKKNIMELMAIDKNGRVRISSSGFSPDENLEMPDYSQALENEEGMGEYVGKIVRGNTSEKYMAVTALLQSASYEYSAVRVVTGLDKIDALLIRLVALTTLLTVFILLIVLVLGIYFVKSILNPVKEMAVSAGKMAKGDFSHRIRISRDDEIGDLCHTFNYMASQLENSEKIKNDFISSVSHELRTPLTAIKGWSETILEMRDEETLKKGMRVITNETQRLSSMVEELLDFSRIQNNRLQLQRANMDVLAELADAVLLYAERAEKSNIILNYHEPEGIAMIFGDKNRLRQVFVNIIDNSVKYIGKDGVINIDAALKEKDIEIKIADNGCGISAEDLPKVKKRFYKANDTVRGSGIGLAVADELVSLHGGRLDIDSVYGEGTTVTITLPILQKKAEEEPKETEAAEKENQNI